ncbi:MAG: FliM/FliN family flagellar motor C-terminal domain-containing protein [Henriciella sp.]
MQNAVRDEQDEWAMSERRERTVMRDIPDAYRKPVPPKDEGFRFPTARGILSKAEIEALLRPNLPKINDDVPEPDDVREVELSKDFPERPAEIDESTRRIAARLSLALGQMSGLKMPVRAKRSAKVGDIPARLARLGGSKAALACFAPEGGDISHILVLPGEIADTLISVACGGRRDAAPSNRELSAIDCALLEQLIRPLNQAFAPGARLSCIETEGDYTGSLISADAGDHMIFEITDGGNGAALELFTLGARQSARANDAGADEGRRKMTALMTARIASLSVPVSKLSSLKPGDTLMLGLPADQPVELLSGERDGPVAFEGEIGRKGNFMAVRIRRSVD